MNNYIEYTKNLLNSNGAATDKLIVMLSNEFRECMFVVDTYRNMKNTANEKRALYEAACNKLAYILGIVNTLNELGYISAESYRTVFVHIHEIRESIGDSYF